MRYLRPEMLTKTPECITEKLVTHAFSGFPKSMKHHNVQNHNLNFLIESCSIFKNLREAAITYFTT